MKKKSNVVKLKDSTYNSAIAIWGFLGVLFFSLSTSALAVEPTTMFDKTKDILIAQFDNKPDGDDIHSQAALGCLLAHADFKGVNYFAVAGAYGKQSGNYINSNSLFNMAYGAQNVKWTDAKADRAGSVIRIRDKAKPILLAGGRVWVQEAGQSDITADWIAALISGGVAASKIKTNVIVVQHSSWNEDNTTAADLTYVKKMANYVPVDDGNSPSGFGVNRGPNTPDYNLTTTTFMITAKSASNPNAASKSYWTEADRIIKASGFNASYSPIPKGGVDFSDCVENWYIFNLGVKASTVANFWSRYVTNAVALKSISISTSEVEHEPMIYKDPATSMLVVEFEDSELIKQVNVFNSLGQMIHSVKTQDASARIDTKSLGLSNMVVVQVIVGKTVINHKLLLK